jgi:hypothetical protein
MEQMNTRQSGLRPKVVQVKLLKYSVTALQTYVPHVTLPGEEAVKDEAKNLSVFTNGRTRFLRDRQRSGCKPFNRVTLEQFGSVGGERKIILTNPPRQTVESALKPSFDGHNAPGTVADDNIVNIQ